MPGWHVSSVRSAGCDASELGFWNGFTHLPPLPPQLQRRHPRRRCGGWPCTHRVAHVQVPLERLPELEVRRQLLRRRNRDFFSDSLSCIVELISVEEGSLPVGSFKYLAMTYPGDIDM
jgi:hypothetical protein